MKYRKIAQKIIQMAILDQKVRKGYELNPAYLKKMGEIDKLNLTKMRKIVKQIGWPTISKVGKKASHMGWLLVQHADRDVRFQQYCLELMKKELESGDVTKIDIAYLTDRILVNKSMKQIYGTQFYRNKTGELVPKPIKDFKNLEKRRKEMNLESFKDYQKKLSECRWWSKGA